MKASNNVTIVIVNNALRIVDNPLLENLEGQVIFVFVLTPYYFGKAHYTDIPNVGENRFKYLFACITKFKQSIKEKFNADLLVLEGTYKQVVDNILTIKSFNKVEVRVLHQPYEYEKAYEKELCDNNNKYNVSIINKGMTLIPFNILKDIYKENKGRSFKDFHFACLRRQAEITFTDNSNINISPVFVDIKSTESEADCLNFFYDIKGLENYKQDKQLISGGTTTKLEGALSLGTLSKVIAYGFALNYQTDDANKSDFVRSLIWNDYCYIIAEIEGSKIFKKNGLSKNINKGKLEVIPDWIKGIGPEVKFYNKTMYSLRTNGYLPNRLRMLIGFYVVKVLGYSPLALAEYFEHYLLGFNPHNNWIGAHSCNGTGVDVISGGRRFNLLNQLQEYDLDKMYL